MNALAAGALRLPSLEEFKVRAKDYAAFLDGFIDEMQDAVQLAKQERAAVARVAGIDRAEGVSSLVNQMQTANRAEYEVEELRNALSLRLFDGDATLEDADFDGFIDDDPAYGIPAGPGAKRMTGEKR